MVFRYDHRLLNGPASINRLRLKLLYAFGPMQRFGMSVLEPLIQADTLSGGASGPGDTEVEAVANIYYRPRFRTGAAVQTTFQTSSDSRIGGATTMIRPSWDLAAVLSNRVELTGVAYYRRSVHTTRGIPAKQTESDITLNTRVLEATWFVEWDSFYDFIPERFAHTMKAGISRRIGSDRRWVLSAYYATGINDHGRQSQYRYNAGLDATWYPGKHR
jgi:hypothetical protein